ncbi:hypothetical protein PNA2_0944 [Pyrococcus sp. NA2]|uniref:hypothetical protein n=1 Tax=Pyrococcus sp. (strain NA2) TaxID=342949 RepID=UPI000209A917|nr:hypothetical protein [Pyrococcus sp. NA2]AEC51860.1 hypothetical protein PNA2_0944 [Pyrococcus sp. NA2]
MRDNVWIILLYVILIVVFRFILALEFLVPFFVFLLLGEILSRFSDKFRYISYVLASFFLFYYLPFPGNSFGLGLTGAGVVLIVLSRKFSEKYIVLIEGFGFVTLLYGLSTLYDPLSPIFKFSAFFSALGYLFAVFESFGIIPGTHFTENLRGISVIGALVGVMKLADLLSGILAFVVKSVALLLSLGIVGYMVNSLPSRKSREEVIVGRLGHEIGKSFHLDDVYEEARVAIEDFVLRGNKEKLVSYITYYALKAGMKVKDVEEMISPIVNYEKRKYSEFAPRWFVELMERREMKKRQEIVMKALRRIKA